MSAHSLFFIQIPTSCPLGLKIKQYKTSSHQSRDNQSINWKKNNLSNKKRVVPATYMTNNDILWNNKKNTTNGMYKRSTDDHLMYHFFRQSVYPNSL